jgi:antibiotic biosynthesis monooxygenase (ABM) superfamily enzyme
MANQVVEMHKGGGLSFWPKPILHPTCPPTFKNSIILKFQFHLFLLHIVQILTHTSCK